MKSGAWYQRNWWAELTMLLRITGTHVLKRELTQCSTLLTNILREKRSKRYLKWHRLKPLQVNQQKLKRVTKRKLKTQPINWTKTKRRNSPCIWTELKLSIFKKYSNKWISRMLSTFKILLASTLFSCNYSSKTILQKTSSLHQVQ